MSVTFTQKEKKAMVAVLQQDYDSVEAAAAAALAAAADLYESRARFTVVGQLYYGREGYVDADDARAAKVSLGMYSTPAAARSAGESLALGQAEQFRWWLLDVHHGTPSDLHKRRKQAHEKAVQAAIEKERAMDRMDAWRRKEGVSSHADFETEQLLQERGEDAA